MSKFDYQKSTDEYIEAYHLLSELMGTDENYFGANCQLEIGNNYLRQKNHQTATAFLFKGN